MGLNMDLFTEQIQDYSKEAKGKVKNKGRKSDFS
jgi:hypothetical protein